MLYVEYVYGKKKVQQNETNKIVDIFLLTFKRSAFCMSCCSSEFFLLLFNIKNKRYKHKVKRINKICINI